MPDMIQKHFSYGHFGQHVSRIGPASASDSVLDFQRKPGSYFLIWMTRSVLGQTHLVQKQAGVQESSGPILAECNGPTTTFPLSYSVALFHRHPESYCAEPAQIQFGSG